MDKGYYDYDFEPLAEQIPGPEREDVSFDEGQAMWARFGLGKFATPNASDPSALQEHAMKMINQNNQ